MGPHAFPNILTAIECAKQEESLTTHDRPSSSPTALYSGTKYSKRTFTKETSQRLNKSGICRNLNRFSPCRCKLPHKKCRNGYQHKCSACKVVSCKVLNDCSAAAARLSHNIVHSQASLPSHNRSHSNVARNTLSSNISAHRVASSQKRIFPRVFQGIFCQISRVF